MWATRKVIGKLSAMATTPSIGRASSLGPCHRAQITPTISDTAKGVIELCLQRTPMPRMGQPAEVAGLVEFLLSDAAGYISGQVIGVDGGYSA